MIASVVRGLGPTMRRRVVITGIGSITPCAYDVVEPTSTTVRSVIAARAAVRSAR